MCGIFGITTISENSVPTLLENLKYLSYRGYDSSGVCLQQDGFYVHKACADANKLYDHVKSQFSNTGIGHTRWATHGKVSIENAHPQLSHDEVAIVHNGIIYNHNELRKSLIEKGYVFISETDTEVIAHLLHQELQGKTPLEALDSIKHILKGRYAFIAMIKNEQTIYGLSNNLPLLIGKNNHSFSVASDLIALKHCDKYGKTPNLTPFFITSRETSLKLDFLSVPKFEDNIDTKEDITYQEILSQHLIPKAIPKINIDNIRPKHVLFVACGSSFHCAHLAHYWLSSIGIYTSLEPASEIKDVVYHNLEDTLVIAISQSGETADTLLAMQNIMKYNPLYSIAITNTPTSTLASLAKHVIPLNIGVERGVASTKAVTAQMLILYGIARALGARLSTKHVLSTEIQRLYNIAKIKQYAPIISKYEHILCLGKQSLLPIAKECALKIKELAYIHAEALPMGELKHGPLALIDENVFCIVLGDANSHHIQTCISEIQARGGEVLRIGPNVSDNIHYISTTQMNDYNPIIINIVCQLLSHQIAMNLNRSIDQPRNLAKSVTVE